MWNAATISALTAGIVAIIGAVFTGLAQLQHARQPADIAHPPATRQPPTAATPPAGPPTAP